MTSSFASGPASDVHTEVIPQGSTKCRSLNQTRGVHTLSLLSAVVSPSWKLSPDGDLEDPGLPTDIVFFIKVPGVPGL